VVELCVIADRRSLQAQDSWCCTALFYMARACLEPTVRLMLQLNADVNAKTRAGNTALMIACKQGCVPIAQLLLKEYHANVHETNKMGWNALFDAALGATSPSCACCCSTASTATRSANLAKQLTAWRHRQSRGV